MGPHYDSIYLMVRQLPEPPDHHFEADATKGTAPGIAMVGIALVGTTKAALIWVRSSPFAELLRILKQPVRRTWSAD